MKLTLEQKFNLSEIVHKHLSDLNLNLNCKGYIELAVEKDMSAVERHAIMTFVGCTLSSHGLVYWPISNAHATAHAHAHETALELEHATANYPLKIGFRAFTHELDSSLLASIYH
jgi:hypothetical protein